jgi:Tol biopolymer transport system component
VSPDGKTVAFFTRSTTNVSSLKVLTVSTGSIRTLVANTGGAALRASWTPDSTSIYWTVLSQTSSATYLKRIARSGSGYTTLPSLGSRARWVLYEKW